MNKVASILPKKIFLLLLFIAILTSLTAHEFWLSPQKFIYTRGEKINVRFFVGKNFEGENWKGNNEKIQSLKIFYGGVDDDLSKYISNQPGDSLTLTMLDEGTNLITYNSKNTFIEIPADKFNEYLTEDGLTDAIDYRKKNNETDSAGREFYQRCAKTIIQVGSIKTKTFSEDSDLPLEIIPVSNPYQLKLKDTFHVKLFFQKEPLKNSLVKIWHRENKNSITIELTTDENGTISFPVKTSGNWMISTVKMIRLENDPKVQWQSYWGSLTWGYQ